MRRRAHMSSPNSAHCGIRDGSSSPSRPDPAAHTTPSWALLQFTLQYFPGGITRQLIDEPHRARSLVVRQTFLAVSQNLVFGEVADDERLTDLAQSLVRHTDHRDITHSLQPRQRLLDLGRIDVETAADVHILEPVGDREIARVIEFPDVAGVQ